MKKFVAFELALLIAMLAFLAGKHIGVQQTIDRLQVFAVEHDLDTGFRVLIDIDGQVHEYTTD